ncbi:hypothetical protein TALC_00032 [Thermoplasmatales archaeon BRNA1]|nr:hypothetical protein TALC_00032 [Thermoplasmatales archaeon BRNA1]
MFLTVVIITFGITMIAAGAFSAYFGKGKSKGFGLLVAAIGLIVLIFWLYLTVWSDITPFCDVNTWDVIYDAIINLIGILIGALIAVGIFLVTVIKS